jgi:hypothetical protein
MKTLRVFLVFVLSVGILFTAEPVPSYAASDGDVIVPTAEDAFDFTVKDGYTYTVDYDIRPRAYIDESAGAPGQVGLTFDFAGSNFYEVNQTPGGKPAPGLVAHVYPMYSCPEVTSVEIFDSPIRLSDIRNAEHSSGLATMYQYIKATNGKADESTLGMLGWANWIQSGDGSSVISLDSKSQSKFPFQNAHEAIVPESMVDSLCNDVIWVVSIQRVFNLSDPNFQTVAGTALVLGDNFEIWGEFTGNAAGMRDSYLLNNPVNAMKGSPTRDAAYDYSYPYEPEFGENSVDLGFNGNIYDLETGDVKLLEDFESPDASFFGKIKGFFSGIGSWFKSLIDSAKTSTTLTLLVAIVVVVIVAAILIRRLIRKLRSDIQAAKAKRDECKELKRRKTS